MIDQKNLLSNKKNILFAAALMVSVHAAAQTEVMAGVMRGKEYGVTYMLPKTQIEIALTVSKHVKTPGDFYKYADRYLRLKNVTAEKQEYWTLDKINTRTVGTPDKEKVYFVKLKDKTVAPLMELTRDGIVRSINLPVSKQGESVPMTRLTPAAETVDPRQYLTEEILLASSNAKMAELVAREIYNIRDSRNALLRGEEDNMPKDGEQLKLMLESLEKQEKALMSMFTGSEKVETKVVEISILPEAMTNEVAFRFSRFRGVVDMDDLSGEPYYITITNLSTPAITGVEAPKKEPEGVAYNVPGRARIELKKDNQSIYREELPVTQFGTTEYLAPVLFNKSSTTTVLFDVNTGGIVKVNRE